MNQIHSLYQGNTFSITIVENELIDALGEEKLSTSTIDREVYSRDRIILYNNSQTQGDLNEISFPEFLLSLIQQKNPPFIETGGIAITYHDPGGLGCELRIFEAPREIIRSIPGSKHIELPLTKDQAPCCGYGVRLSFSHPEITRLMSHRLASMASDTGADMVVTGCPTCWEIILENIIEDESADRSTELLDLSLLLDRMLQ